MPASSTGWTASLWAPLLHGDWAHLVANTVPFLVFGFLAMAGGIAQFVVVTATIWVLGGRRASGWSAPANTSTSAPPG